MAMMDALTPRRPRLVGEERTEGGDDRDESGVHQIMNHVLDVLVGGWGLFVEQLVFRFTIFWEIIIKIMSEGPLLPCSSGVFDKQP